MHSFKIVIGRNLRESTFAIPGTRHLTYLEQNVAATGCQLTADEVAELDELFPTEKVVGTRYPEAGMSLMEQGRLRSLQQATILL